MTSLVKKILTWIGGSSIFLVIGLTLGLLLQPSVSFSFDLEEGKLIDDVYIIHSTQKTLSFYNFTSLIQNADVSCTHQIFKWNKTLSEPCKKALHYEQYLGHWRTEQDSIKDIKTNTSEYRLEIKSWKTGEFEIRDKNRLKNLMLLFKVWVLGKKI